jgi:hypothetical protein
VTQVFLNYRAADEPFSVGMLDQILSKEFGSSAVFFASKSIELGSLWEPEMFTAVEKSVAVLVVIGRFWLTATDDDGVLLLGKEDDFVRREILLGMQTGKKVIPVLLGTRRPKRGELPEALRPLAERQSISIAYRSTGLDIGRLVTKLREEIPELRKLGSSPDALPGPGNTTKFVQNGDGHQQNYHAHEIGTIVNFEAVRRFN